MGVDDASGTQEVRVVSVYATRYRHRWLDGDDGPASLTLGRIEEFYIQFREQLPRLLARVSHSPRSVRLRSLIGEPDSSDITAGLEMDRAEVWLFVLPSDEVVAVLDLRFQSPPPDVDASRIIDVLEHGAYGHVSIAEQRLEWHIAKMAREAGVEVNDANPGLSPERHQIVFVPEIGEGAPVEETIALILYRSDPPYRPLFMSVRRPAGLNTAGAIGAVTPFVSLLSGHPEYVENSAFLTVVQAVANSARLRQIWATAHGRVREFRRSGERQGVGIQENGAIGLLAEELGNLELELFSVEASADLGSQIPLLRIESFYKELHSAMELFERAETVSRMLARVNRSLRAEIAAIELREQVLAELKAERQQLKEERQQHRNTAMNVLTYIAALFGLVLAFFGINAQQVHGEVSIFDWGHYIVVYLVAAGLAITPLVVLLILRGRARIRSRKQRRERMARSVSH